LLISVTPMEAPRSDLGRFRRSWLLRGNLQSIRCCGLDRSGR